MPDIAEALRQPKPITGGWLYSSLSSLKNKELQIAVATVYKLNELESHYVNGIMYFLLPLHKGINKYQRHLESNWRKVCEEFKPDIIHIHGTEFPHGLSCVRACSNIRIVVSIQGLLTPIVRYYLAGMSFKDIIKNTTIRDILFRSGVFQSLKDFQRRSCFEREIITKVGYAIGRTSWDKTHVLSINPNIEYFNCDETLRPFFYNNIWNYSNCKKHTILVSQAVYPLKGFHQLLKAMPLVLRYYPDAKVFVAGKNILKCSSIKDYLHRTGYWRFVKKLIRTLKLQENIIFLGFLDEEDMGQAFLDSNVYVCPSSIENSPNSLGEALLLGIPCVASYVGGVPDIMKGHEQWLYRFDEYEMLTSLICRAFEIRNTQEREIALVRYDASNNASNLMKIYERIIKIP